MALTCGSLIFGAQGTVCVWNLAPPTSENDEPARHTEAFRARALMLRQVHETNLENHWSASINEECSSIHARIGSDRPYRSVSLSLSVRHICLTFMLCASYLWLRSG